MDGAIIYVAGNPDAYPVEYYDRETESYQGLIPELLRRFGQENGCDIRYFQPDQGDQRKELASFHQVDLISGCTESEQYEHLEGAEILVLPFVKQGEENGYRILITEAAPSGLAEKLRTSLGGVSQEEKTGFLLSAAEREEPVNLARFHNFLIGALLAVLVLLTALILIARRYRRRLSAAEEDRETDALTGIGNREYLLRYFNQVINDGNKILYCVLCFHIDTERIARDAGREQTDRFLRHVAMVLRDYAADMDILARISDGGFVLLRLSVDAEEERRWLNAVLNRLSSVPVLKDAPEARYFAVGSYQIQREDHDINEVIFDAMECARAAYLAGEEYGICTDEVLQRLHDERILQADIQHGLEYGEFILYLQFYIDPATGSAVGAEALSRWNHPSRGLLLPGEFVPLMERERLVSGLDECCLENVCRFLEELKRNGEKTFFVSCNISNETAGEERFPEKCREILNRYDFPRERLIFELKGNASSGIIRNIKCLREMGVRLAMDDFGEGFGSFEQLQDWQPDLLKIDRCLVDGIGTKTGESVLRGMIGVCRELGISVVAEGVETMEQAVFLSNHQCDLMLGYRFGHPMPEQEVRRQILSQKRKE